MKKTYAKFQNDRYKTKRSCAHKRYPLSIYGGWKMTNSQCGKSDKKCSNNYTQTTCNPHTMKKTYAKFQNDQYKTVRGFALTRGTHCLYTEGEKWLSSQCEKSDKKCSNNYTQTTCTSSYHEENICKVSKRSVQNCKRSCAHKRYTLSVYWGWKMTKFTKRKKWQKII